MIYLLDLNYTLVENSHQKARPFLLQIQQERYRQWLVDLLQPHRVFLITARPVNYQEVTLDRITQTTGWCPERAYFNTLNLSPPNIKRHWLTSVLLPEFGTEPFYGLESNPVTRSMYAEYGIPSVKVTGEIWQQLPNKTT